MLDAEALRRGIEPVADDDEHDGRFAAAVAWPRVLELYAGSGALAIEALSRGATHADLVEVERRCPPRDRREPRHYGLDRTSVDTRTCE